MTIQDDDLIAEFVVESNEHMADIESQLLAIEAAGASIDSDLVNKVFRAIHSIKGAAGFLGLSVINRLSHAMENVLNQIRNRELVPTTQIVDVLLKSADFLRNLINTIATSNEADISDHTQRLEAIFQPASKTATIPAANFSSPVVKVDTIPETTAAAPNLAAEIPAMEPALPQLPPAPVSVAATPTIHAEPAAPSSVSSAPETNVRVPVSVLDRLMNLAGELVLSRNQLVQAVAKDEKTALTTATGGLNQVTSELQEAIMRTRMQPVGNVFGRFPRLVRDLSAKLSKQVELHIEGKEVEVDKTIIEAIGDPLTHIIRNSVDHGIETPAVRTANGKAPAGTVRLMAYHQAGKVRIDIIDDGGGINPQRLRNKAVAMQLLTAEQAQALSDRDAIRLIFHPGLSTAEKVTDVSGRGVGMDVVRTNIERLGGNVDVESVLGSGTTLKITLPLTLAIIPSLIVRGCNQKFAIPQANIQELVRVRRQEVEQRICLVNKAEVLRLRNTLLPLIRLETALGWENKQQAPSKTASKHAVNILVLEGSSTRYGLIVDGLQDSEEIVVKPLGRHLKDCPCMAGATILGDGHVALILDIDGIANQTHLRSSSAESEVADVALDSQRLQAELLKLLIFRNHPSEQFAVPMALISRIQRVRSSSIGQVGEQQLLLQEDRALPLLSLESIIKANPRSECSQVYIIIFRVAGREVGLIAPTLEDIQDVATNIDTHTLQEPGVIGSLIVQGLATRLLDLSELVRQVHPTWFDLRPSANNPTATTTQQRVSTNDPLPAGPQNKIVVLAEDSPFFRKQVAGFLEREGYTVKPFEDGKQAWDYLVKHGNEVDIVVTDIEMPVMTGLQLCRHVKDHPSLGRLPVVALTTLAGDDDIQRGLDAGVNDYQIKMDREQLLWSVQKLLADPSANQLTRHAQGEVATCSN